MNKMILALAIGTMFASISVGQDCDRHSRHRMQFKVAKPASVVKSTVTFTTKAGKSILCSAKKIVKAPFRDVEFDVYEYTFPKLDWKKGIFKKIPSPPTEEELKEYLIPIVIDDGPLEVIEY